MPRATIDQYYCDMLKMVASRATCRRRSVGAIIVDGKGRVLSMGYNGVPSGFDHCVDEPCPGAEDRPGDNTRCQAIHAEVNAILQCRTIEFARTIYVSCFPCFSCAKMLLNTPITRVVALGQYSEGEGLNLWYLAGREVSFRVNDEKDAV